MGSLHRKEGNEDKMTRIDEHKRKMQDIKKQADEATGKKKQELMKCYHRMAKELRFCNYNIKQKEGAING